MPNASGVMHAELVVDMLSPVTSALVQRRRAAQLRVAAGGDQGIDSAVGAAAGWPAAQAGAENRHELGEAYHLRGVAITEAWLGGWGQGGECGA